MYDDKPHACDGRIELATIECIVVEVITIVINKVNL